MTSIPMPPPGDMQQQQPGGPGQQPKGVWAPMLIGSSTRRKIPDPESMAPIGILQTAIRASDRMRRTSEDSGDSFDAYDTELPSGTGESGGRRMSITERFFGRSMPTRERSGSIGEEQSGSGEKKISITENMEFKEFMKRHNKILGDEEWQ